MKTNLKVTIASQSSGILNTLESALLANDNFLVDRFLIPEDQRTAIDSTIEACDVLVLGLTAAAKELPPLVGSLPLVVTAPDSDPELMRLSFKAGASDFLYEPVDQNELISAVENALVDKAASTLASEADTTLFVSPKGGAGATTLAVHVSHILSTREHQPQVLLMDLDLQYGSLPIHFNEKPTAKLASALVRGDQIDSTNFEACVSRVHPNLHTLATYSEQLRSAWETDLNAVHSMLTLAALSYDHVLVDIPRSIDPVTYSALERATRICVVVQQTIADMHMAHQYVRFLHDQGIATDSMTIVVNRFEKGNAIHLEDFENAFDGLKVHGIPNDYKRVRFSSENTVSLIAKWRNSVITKNMIEFTDIYWPDQSKPRRWTFSHPKDAGRAA